MTWQFDPAHSHIQFAVRHMMISTVRGEFQSFSGTIDFDPERPAQTDVRVEIDASSINTRAEDRDNHLRSPDFLNVAEYPTITFVGKRVEKTGPNTGRLIGDLTIRDITNEVALDVKYAGTITSPWGSTSAGFTAETKFDRTEWDLTWNQALEAGGILVGDDVKVTIELELVKVAEEQPA